jgi:hypothetical protein
MAITGKTLRPECRNARFRCQLKYHLSGSTYTAELSIANVAPRWPRRRHTCMVAGRTGARTAQVPSTLLPSRS